MFPKVKLQIDSNSVIFNSLRRNISEQKSSFDNSNVPRKLAALATAYNEQSRIYASNILDILESSSPDLLKDDQGLLLLQSCRYAISDQVQERSFLCTRVWKKLEESGVRFHSQHYNTYLQICLENRIHVDFTKFLTEMSCEPDEETYRLLLNCACEGGEVDQAVKIVTLMKEKKFPADEQVFNALVLGHAINGGLAAAEKVLETMQIRHVPVTSETYNELIRGLALRGDHQEFMKSLKMFSGVVKEKALLRLLLAIVSSGNHSWLKEVMPVIGPIELSKQSLQRLNLLCVHLVHLRQPEAALVYYKTFAEPSTSEETYGFFLLEEMLHSGTDTETIIELTKDLKKAELNSIALEKLTGVALRKGYTVKAWALLQAMTDLRPHYFWPLLLQASRQEGETGVLNTLKKMLDWGVKPDMDTLEYYCIALCDAADPKQLLLRLQNLGLTVRELFTPLLAYLLRNHDLASAADLCKAHNVPVHSERLLQPLVKAWHYRGAAENTIRILQTMHKSATASADYTGQFLLRALKNCKTPMCYERFLELLKVMKRKELQISITISDSLAFWLKSPSHRCIITEDIQLAIDNLVNPALNHQHIHIPHPRDMNVSELEHHLTELQNKNMETRGVLRRLIQEQSRQGNLQRANELRKQFAAAGFEQTPGMKASLLQTYLTMSDMNGALSMYDEIKAVHPSFVLDGFKIIDLAYLLVTNGQFELAVNIIMSESENKKARGGPNLLRNCWRLISAGADEMQVTRLYELLVEGGYCVPSTITLGPLVKVHLNKCNLAKALEIYKDSAEKYNCTPLQLELLCALIKAENEELLQEALNITSRVHGAEIATTSLIAALAQNGYHKSLRKLLLESKGVSKKDIQKRCERWVTENKLDALETLAQAAYRLPTDIIDLKIVYHAIMRLHGRNNDCESAIEFYRQLVEKEHTIPKKIVDELLRLANRCRYQMPAIVETEQNS